jgi:hypothetical protein
MKADFYRFQADFLTGEKLKNAMMIAQETYNIAT